MTVLSSVTSAVFVSLLCLTGATNANLSSHLMKLGESGLIRIEKTFVVKKPNSTVGLTPIGKERINHRWA